MNDNYSEGQGGAHIIPSARKSIHSHGNCPYALQETMGGYGLNSPSKTSQNKPTTASTHTDEVDEVDNVLSKMTPPSDNQISSRYNKGKKELLRNRLNYHLSNSNIEDEESDFDEWPDNYEQNLSSSSILSTSNQSRKSPQTSTQYRTVQSNLSRSAAYKSNDTLKDVIDNKTNNNIPIIACIVIICGVLYYYSTSNVSPDHTIHYDVVKFYKEMNTLAEKYKLSGDSILQVQSGISTIYERQDAGSFIFVYNSKNTGYNSKLLEDFLDDISLISAKYLRNNTVKVHHLELNSASLDVETSSEFIKRYRSEVDKAGVMLLKEMDRVPSTLATAFHYYCDEYNPLVKRSAIFFTLNLANCSNQSNAVSSHALIEKCLTSKWNGVQRELMIPLLNRVVSVVIDITNNF